MFTIFSTILLPMISFKRQVVKVMNYFLLILVLITTACRSKNSEKSKQLVAEWVNYVSVQSPPNDVIGITTISIEEIFQFNENGKGRKTEKHSITNGKDTSANTSYKVEYPFDWEVKNTGLEDYAEIKYYQGEIKELTPGDQAQQQNVNAQMVEKNGSIYLLYFKIEDNRKLICHNQGDTTQFSYIRKEN